MKKGKFFGVGIGPGCPDLVTVKGAQLISDADVIYVPTKDTIEKSIAYNTIKPYIKDSLIKPAIFSMSYKSDILDSHRDKVIEEIKIDINKGLDVVFVTLGDTTLYSTYSYILDKLRKAISNLSFETIPGITSFSSLAANTSTSLVEEDEVLTIYPMTHFSKERFNSLYENSNSLVLMKIPKKSSEIVNFIKSKKFSKIIHMKNICLPNQEINFDISSSELQDDSIQKYLSILLLKK